MKKAHIFFLASTFLVFSLIFVGGLILTYMPKRDGNPYINDGLVVRWDVGGATNSYPWINVWVLHEGSKIEPDIRFGGIEDPSLKFEDFNGDGHIDIIFFEGDVVQAVAFYPAINGQSPRFETLRNDVTW